MHSSQRSQNTSFKSDYCIVKNIIKENGKIREIVSQENCSMFSNNLDFLIKNYGRLKRKNILMLAVQGIQQIKELHQMGYVHRDIRLESFVLDPQGKNFKLIDFCSSKCLPKIINNKKLKSSLKKNEFQNSLYTSVYVHLGLEASKRDDLISLGYILIHLFTGKLPWSDFLAEEATQKSSLTYQSKSNTTIGELCEGLPKEMVLFFEHLFKLSSKENPNYEFLIKLFEELMKDEGICYDLGFEWNLKGVCQGGIDLTAIRVNSPPLTIYLKNLMDLDDDLLDKL